MENFDELSNNELRVRLKQQGFANIPVTNTTRNILIKKLKGAVDGTKAKSRRETVNVPKVASTDESEFNLDTKKASKTKSAANRRATIANTVPPPSNVTDQEKIIKIVPKPLAPVFLANKKPGRTTPLLSQNIFTDIAENSDDELLANLKEPVIPRKASRSPSLGKSTVVTTSYKHTIEPVHEQDDDVILLNEESDVGEESFVENVQPTFDWSSTFRSKNNAIADKRRTLLDGYGSNVQHGQVSLDKPIEPIAITTDSSFRRRYTTNTTRDYKSNGDGDESPEEDPLNKVETPFLSDFTRRLAKLKADPITKIDYSFDYDSSSKPKPTSVYRPERQYQTYSSTRNQYSRTLHIDNNKAESAWKNLEKKIRWPLFILLALFVIVFIYVFFLQTD